MRHGSLSPFILGPRHHSGVDIFFQSIQQSPFSLSTLIVYCWWDYQLTCTEVAMCPWTSLTGPGEAHDSNWANQSLPWDFSVQSLLSWSPQIYLVLLHFALLYFADIVFFHKLKVCGIPVLSDDDQHFLAKYFKIKICRFFFFRHNATAHLIDKIQCKHNFYIHWETKKIHVLDLSSWSGTKPAISLRYACILEYCRLEATWSPVPHQEEKAHLQQEKMRPTYRNWKLRKREYERTSK